MRCRRRRRNFTAVNRKKCRLEVEDLRMVKEYLQQVESREAGRHCDFLFFYVTHYNYYYPARAGGGPVSCDGT